MLLSPHEAEGGPGGLGLPQRENDDLVWPFDCGGVNLFLLGWSFLYLRPPLPGLNGMFKCYQVQIVLKLHPPSVADRAG